MPYNSTKDVSDKVKGTEKLNEKKKRQFLHVYNSCLEKGGDEAKCHAQAWGVVKKTAMSERVAMLHLMNVECGNKRVDADMRIELYGTGRLPKAYERLLESHFKTTDKREMMRKALRMKIIPVICENGDIELVENDSGDLVKLFSSHIRSQPDYGESGRRCASMREAGVRDVTLRIVKKIRDSDLAERMIEKVRTFFRTKNQSEDISPPEASMLYKNVDFSETLTMSKKRDLVIDWTNHAKYRSELRDINPVKVNDSLLKRLKMMIQKKLEKRKVRFKEPGLGTMVVDYDTTGKPAKLDVISVWAGGEVSELVKVAREIIESASYSWHEVQNVMDSMGEQNDDWLSSKLIDEFWKEHVQQPYSKKELIHGLQGIGWGRGKINTFMSRIKRGIFGRAQMANDLLEAASEIASVVDGALTSNELNELLLEETRVSSVE